MATFQVDLYSVDVELDDEEIIDYIAQDVDGALDLLDRRHYDTKKEVLDWITQRAPRMLTRLDTMEDIEQLAAALDCSVEMGWTELIAKAPAHLLPAAGISPTERQTLERAAHTFDCLAIAADSTTAQLLAEALRALAGRLPVNHNIEGSTNG